MSKARRPRRPQAGARPATPAVSGVAEPLPPPESSPVAEAPRLPEAAAALRSEPQLRLSLEPFTWAFVLVISALARLPALGVVPLRLGDSGRALAAWQVAQGQQPLSWSGGIVETLTAAIFWLAGSGDGRARLAASLFGIGLVAAVWLLRPFVGRAPALLAALLLALSPVCIAVSRSVSPYAAGALVAVLTVALVFSFLEQPRSGPLAALAAVLGLGFSSDASFLVVLLTLALFLVLEGLWGDEELLRDARAYLTSQRRLYPSLALILAAGLLLSLTRFGIAPDRLRSAAFSSWSEAFSAGAGLPWHLPLSGLAGYEPLLLVAGVSEAVLLWRRSRRQRLRPFERFLLYWLGAGLIFILIATRREMGQLLLLLVPLALLSGIAVSRWLSTAVWNDLRPARLPALLAVPAFVYVLFVLQASVDQQGLAANQAIAALLLFGGGLALITLGAIWAQHSAPAFLAAWGLAFGLLFALHSLTHVGFQSGDEYLLGPVATVNAPALAHEIDRVAPTLSGPTSIDPSLAQPLGWYTRGHPAVRIGLPSRASGGIVQPVDQTVPPAFQTLIAGNPIARSWYPSTLDAAKMLRWLLYRQAWGRVSTTSARVLLKGP